MIGLKDVGFYQKSTFRTLAISRRSGPGPSPAHHPDGARPLHFHPPPAGALRQNSWRVRRQQGAGGNGGGSGGSARSSTV
eukprot:1180961-Prorocentrum_minimum.AAC.6